jgi:hypothetical protein
MYKKSAPFIDGALLFVYVSVLFCACSGDFKYSVLFLSSFFFIVDLTDYA